MLVEAAPPERRRARRRHRFRPGPAQFGRRPLQPLPFPERRRRDLGHPRLHGAGAGRGRSGDAGHRRLCARGRPLRDGHGHAAVPGATPRSRSRSNGCRSRPRHRASTCPTWTLVGKPRYCGVSHVSLRSLHQRRGGGSRAGRGAHPAQSWSPQAPPMADHGPPDRNRRPGPRVRRLASSLAPGADPEPDRHDRAGRFLELHGRCGLRRYAQAGAGDEPAAITLLQRPARPNGARDPDADGALSRGALDAGGGPGSLPTRGRQGRVDGLDREHGQQVRDRPHRAGLPERRFPGQADGRSGEEGRRARHPRPGGDQAAGNRRGIAQLHPEIRHAHRPGHDTVARCLEGVFVGRQGKQRKGAGGSDSTLQAGHRSRPQLRHGLRQPGKRVCRPPRIRPGHRELPKGLRPARQSERAREVRALRLLLQERHRGAGEVHPDL